MTPLISIPGIAGSGGIHPYVPRRTRTSGMLTPIACAFTSTSSGAGDGVGTSTYSRTSGPPVLARRIAFMRAPGSVGDRAIDLDFRRALDEPFLLATLAIRGQMRRLPVR